MTRFTFILTLVLFCPPILAEDSVEASGKSELNSGTKNEDSGEGETISDSSANALKPKSTEPPNTDDLEYLKLPDPPMVLGDTGDRIRELQATLNENLTGGKVSVIPIKTHPVWVGPALPEGESVENQVRVVCDPRGQFKPLQVRGDWRPTDKDGELLRPASGDKLVEAFYVQLPETPLKVDGVYGQRTYAAVMLFQLMKNLPTTGEVDAVTLDKLEPMIPTNRMLAAIMSWVQKWKPEEPLDSWPWIVKTVTALIMTTLIVLVSGVFFQVARSLSRSTRFLSRWLFTPSTSPWFNMLREKQVFVRMAQFAPAIFIYCAAIVIFPAPEATDKTFPYLDVFQDWHSFVSRIGLAYAALVFVLVSLALADACDAILSPDQEVDNPISGIVRASKRIVSLIGTLLIVAALLGQSPWTLLGGLGAFTAVILLVFRDYLLGLVASVQIIANRMVGIGDWIEMPKFGADGDVTGISLNVIKVHNFDRTISTIPTHAILTESFRNWSSMHSAGARRIKRAIYIDVHSIQVCTQEMIEQFRNIELIRSYIEQKLEDLDDYNTKHDIGASLVNSRRLTNIGTFRAYLEAYLEQHPGLTGEMTFLVRHLQPTQMGLPVEVYAYSSETNWKPYEAVQADIFDHILAILPEFGLRAFQDVTQARAGEEVPGGDPELQRKFEEAEEFVEQQNRHLTDRPNSRTNAALRRVEKRLAELGLDDGATVELSGRTLSLSWESNSH